MMNGGEILNIYGVVGLSQYFSSEILQYAQAMLCVNTFHSNFQRVIPIFRQFGSYECKGLLIHYHWNENIENLPAVKQRIQNK